jgi:DNA polymerase-3 subunit epsilon
MVCKHLEKRIVRRMRLVILDTETTGLSPTRGDRMVEIGCVEVSRRHIQRNNSFHHLINPGRPIPEEVVRIHGISDADVVGKPSFADIAGDFIEFIEGATLVIHNAAFDLGFIMNELQLAGLPNIHEIPVLDSLSLARSRHPHQRNNLDALCDRYDVDRSHRTKHGALLDAELLAEVYLAMTGGRQFTLTMEDHSLPASSFVQLSQTAAQRQEKVETANIMRRPRLAMPEEDQKAHEALLQRVHSESGQALWMLPVTD